MDDMDFDCATACAEALETVAELRSSGEDQASRRGDHLEGIVIYWQALIEERGGQLAGI